MTTENTAPKAAQDWLVTNTREESVLDHGFELKLDWWNPKITDLPGGPVTSEEGRTSGRGRINRRLLFSLADQAVKDDSGAAAVNLLWHTLLWGAGDTNRGNRKRIESVAKDPKGAAEVLRDAARASRVDAREAFLILRPRGTAIKGLGPGFFTKFLYFAGAGDPDHGCLIVDSRVQRTLWVETGKTHSLLKPNFSYGPNSYCAAIELLQAWARDASTENRTVAADEMERWAFGR